MPFVRAGRTIVSSNQINPGIIVDSDVNASAAIQATKIQELSVGVNGGVLPSTGLADAHVAAAAAIALSKLAAGTHGGVMHRTTAGVMTELPVGTSGYFLKTQGAGADPVWAAAGASESVASDNLKVSADTVNNHTNTSFEKSKSIQTAYAGVVRVKYESQSVTSSDTDTEIYLNGVTTGVGERNSTNNYVAYSHDINVPAGATVELWVKRTGGSSSNVKNFRLCFDKQSIAADGTVILD